MQIKECFTMNTMPIAVMGFLVSTVGFAIYEERSTLDKIEFDLKNPKEKVISSTSFNRYCSGILDNSHRASNQKIHTLCLKKPQSITRESFENACRDMPTKSEDKNIQKMAELCQANLRFLDAQQP